MKISLFQIFDGNIFPFTPEKDVVHAIEVRVREVVHEVKNVTKDLVEEKRSHIANVSTPVHLIRPILQTVEEIEVESDQEDQEVKTEVKRINVLEVVVLIKEREQVIKMILNLQRPGRNDTILFQVLSSILTGKLTDMLYLLPS